MNYIAQATTSLSKFFCKYSHGKISVVLLLLAFYLIPVKHSFAQIPNCSANVPTFNVDFTGNPGGTFTTGSLTRQGNCCGTSSPDRCIHFAITLDTADVAVNFQIVSGAIPGGSLFYQIDCGPQNPVGSHICVSGPGVHHLTFCKPGNNANVYQITSIPPSTAGTNITLNDGCVGNITATGFNPSTVTTCLPLILPNAVRQDVTLLYLTSPLIISPIKTVQAPQSPSRQPIFVPVRFL